MWGCPSVRWLMSLFSSLSLLNSGFGGSPKAGAVNSHRSYINLLLVLLLLSTCPCAAHRLRVSRLKLDVVLASAFQTEYLEGF